MSIEESSTITTTTLAPSPSPDGASWFALWTHPHCESLVERQLAAKGFSTLLPLISTWSRRGGNRHIIRIPMFPGYLFLRHAMDKRSYIEIVKTRGLTRILGAQWDRLAVVDEADIEAITKVVHADVLVLPHPYLREGQWARITHGPLKDVEGILVQLKPAKGHLVISVKLLQRSVAVEVDWMHVEPIATPHRPNDGVSAVASLSPR